jgi:hypothetical protein
MADRDDPYIQAHKKPVIVPKDGSFKGFGPGYYIHPEVYGQPIEKSYNYILNKKDKLPRLVKQSEEVNTEKVEQTKSETKKPKIK